MSVTFTYASSDTTQGDRDRDLSIVKQRIAAEKLTGVTAGVSRDGRAIVVQGPAAEKDQIELLGRAGVLGFREVLATAAANEAIAGPAPKGVPVSLWQQYLALDCKNGAAPAKGSTEQAAVQIVACQNDNSQKYILDATAVSGTSVTSASAAPGQAGKWLVTMSFNSQGTAQFSQLTSRLADSNGQVAITVDGAVYEAPTIQSPITDGQLQITGNFDQDTAQGLAVTLQNGELPVGLLVSGVTGPAGPTASSTSATG